MYHKTIFLLSFHFPTSTEVIYFQIATPLPLFYLPIFVIKKHTPSVEPSNYSQREATVPLMVRR